jgi:hypothetical protein
MLADPAFQTFYHAPVLILISGDAPGFWIAEDCALAAENLMLLAFSLGLGSCWIGFAQSYLNTPAGKQALGIPDSWVRVAPIIVGFASAQPVAVQEPLRGCAQKRGRESCQRVLALSYLAAHAAAFEFGSITRCEFDR